MAYRQKESGRSFRQYRVLGRHSGQDEHRNVPRQSRCVCPLSRSPAFPLGVFRRFLPVPLRQSRPGRKERRHGRVRSSPGKSAQALHETRRPRGLPLDLAGYENFVRQTLADNQKKGGVAMKFEAAYFRSLYFGDPPRASAEAIYAKFHAGGLPSEQEYRTFQDYVFRVMIDQAGKLDLPVHFHSAVGIGDYFSLTNGTPLNLENVLRDPRYKNVKFVLIHGGYPHTLEMIWMTAAKNVYTDSSLMGYYVYPSELKNILKQWISLYPERMMFGSDAFPFNDAVGAEETFWLAARSARTAVAAALAELIAEGAFTEARALELARMYLHDNAAKLYGDGQ